MSREDRRLGIAWALASALGGALFVVPWKLANAVGEASHSVLLLLGSAALMNTALAAGQRLKASSARFHVSRVDLWVAALLASFTLLGNRASAEAIQVLSPALHQVVLRAEVILVAVLAWLFLGERVEPRFWLGVGLAVLGFVLLQGRPGEPIALETTAYGTGMALGAAACFSALSVVTRGFIHRIDPVAVNALRLWLAVALWFPFNGWPRFSEIPAEQAVYAALAALAGPFFGRLCLMLSARYVEARLGTLANLSAPVMTLGFAFVLLSDWPERHELLGGAIMIAGIAIPLLRRRGRRA